MNDHDPFLHGGEGRSDDEIKAGAVVTVILFGAFVWFAILIGIMHLIERLHG